MSGDIVGLGQAGTWRSGGRILALPDSLPDAGIISNGAASNAQSFNDESSAQGPTSKLASQHPSGKGDPDASHASYNTSSQQAGISAKRGLRIEQLPDLPAALPLGRESERQQLHLGGGGGGATTGGDIASKLDPQGLFLASGHAVPAVDVLQAAAERSSPLRRAPSPKLVPGVGGDGGGGDLRGGSVGLDGAVSQGVDNVHEHYGLQTTKGRQASITNLTTVSKARSKLSARTGHSSPAQSL